MRVRDTLAPAAIVLLLFAGYIKGSPLLAWVPADLTLLGLLLTVLFCVASFIGDRGRFPAGTGWALALVVAFLIPVWYSPTTTYATEKVGLLPVTAACLVAPMLIVNSRERLWWFLRWLVVGGVAVTLLAQYGPQGDVYERLATAGGGTIGFGRATGLGLVAVVALVLAGRAPRLLAVLVAAALTYSLVGSGSRGPLVAAGLAILTLVAARRSGHRVRDTLLTAGVGAVGLWWAFAQASTFTQDRILLLFANDQGASINTRERLYGDAAEQAWAHIGGLGWGGLQPFMFPLDYPHNILLEVFAEGGWLAGLVLVGALVAGVRRARRRSVEPAAVAVLALLAFQFVNAMVSGDVNDNRAMFAMLGLALALPSVLDSGPSSVNPSRTGRPDGLAEGRVEHARASAGRARSGA